MPDPISRPPWSAHCHRREINGAGHADTLLVQLHEAQMLMQLHELDKAQVRGGSEGQVHRALMKVNHRALARRRPGSIGACDATVFMFTDLFFDQSETNSPDRNMHHQASTHSKHTSGAHHMRQSKAMSSKTCML